MDEPVAPCRPEKPVEVTRRQVELDQPAEPPSELLTPLIARAASSAARASCSRLSAVGSVGSNRSRSGRGPLASRSAGARPA